MYKLLTAFIGCLLLLSCREQQKASPFFEGYVEYAVKTEVLDNTQETKENMELQGNKMICYFKNGNFIRTYSDSNNIVTWRFLYNQQQNNFYYIFNKGPIVRVSAVNDSSKVNNITVKDGISQQVLGYNCPSVKMSADYQSSDGIKPVYSEFFFCEDLILDTTIITKMTFGGYNRALMKHPNIAIKIIEGSMGHYKKTATGIRIVPTLVRDSMFAVPANREILDL